MTIIDPGAPDDEIMNGGDGDTGDEGSGRSRNGNNKSNNGKLIPPRRYRNFAPRGIKSSRKLSFYGTTDVSLLVLKEMRNQEGINDIMGGGNSNGRMAGMAGILGMLGGAHHSPPSSPSYDAIVTTVKDSQNGITTTTITEQYYGQINNSKNEQLQQHQQQQQNPNVPSKNDRNKESGNNTLEILRTVAPEGRLGLAVREVGEWDVDRKGLETGSGRIHDLYTLRLDVLEVTVGNLTEIFDETDGKSNHGTERQKAAAERIKKDAKGRRIEIPPTNNTNTTGNNTTTLTNAGDTSLTPPPNTPWFNFLASMTKGLERTGKGLQLNANMLWNEVTDAEFGHRFVDAGGKVAGNFGTTLERTVGVAGDVWRMWRDGRSDGSGDGDGDGND